MKLDGCPAPLSSYRRGRSGAWKRRTARFSARRPHAERSRRRAPNGRVPLAVRACRATVHEKAVGTSCGGAGYPSPTQLKGNCLDSSSPATAQAQPERQPQKASRRRRGSLQGFAGAKPSAHGRERRCAMPWGKAARRRGGDGSERPFAGPF